MGYTMANLRPSDVWMTGVLADHCSSWHTDAVSDKHAENPYRGLLRVFDRPLWRDWIFWLFVASIAASLVSRMGSNNPGQEVEPVSGLIDAAFVAAVNYVIWAVIPSTIRSRVRARRHKSDLAEAQEVPATLLSTDSSSLLHREPSDDLRDERNFRGEGKSRRIVRLAPVAIAAVVAGLFLHGNWEYRQLLTTIEGGEAVLEGYNREVKVLIGLLDSNAPNFNRTRAIEGVAKWERTAGERNAELQPWLTKLQGGGFAFWNGGTASVRDLAERHFRAWSQHLESESLDMFYSARASRTDEISTTFKELCVELQNVSPAFAWPSTSRSDTAARVKDICDD